MRELLLDFASIPSPPHDTAVAAEWFAGCLRACGDAEVQIRRDQPRTPTVIAGFPGRRRGPILEIHGHLDAPEDMHQRARFNGHAVVGSGIVAGKAELIAAAEAARVLSAAGPLPGGGLLVVATTGREARAKEEQCLTACIDRGVVGDAVLIAGGDHRVAPVVGLGLGVFHATFAPLEGPTHERSATARTAGEGHGAAFGGYTAIDAAQAFVSLLRRRRAQLARHAVALLGTESLFVSSIRGGDRYYRLPATCEVEGNWRWRPERAATDIFRELEEMTQQAARMRGVRANLALSPLRTGFRSDAAAPLVRALRHAYQQVTGESLPLGTSAYASCAEVLQRHAGISVISHGVDTATFRGDPEEVSMDELVRVARTYLSTAVSFLDHGETAIHSGGALARGTGYVEAVTEIKAGACADMARETGLALGVEGAR
jgi:acetylornithine deacetylase/succinyl-diaminopimelate desuccinylase-like protein